MPSGASAAQRNAARRSALTFFLDHQIGRYQVAEALRNAGAKVEVHLDHFQGDAPDSEWIPEVASHGWVLITKDQNIRRNPLERAAYEAAKLRGFVVTGKNMNAKELGELLVAHLSAMVRRTAGRTGPLLFTISRFGVFRKLI
jgi:predicted nuclease of predicted toxin-antitoxin system